MRLSTRYAVPMSSITSTPISPAHYAFWPARLPHTITVPVTSVWDNLAVSARRYPDNPALHYFGRTTCYRQLCEDVEHLAAWLHHTAGVQRGERVIVLMQNIPQLIIAHYAILRANAVVVPVNPMNMADELEHYIADSDAKLAITSADLAAELVKANNALPVEQRLAHLLVSQFTDAFDATVQGDDAPPSIWRDWLLPQRPLPTLNGGSTYAWQEALQCNLLPPAHTVGRDDLAALPYTSGTTGKPKGCMHPHRSINHNIVASSYWGNSTSESVVLAVVPLFHITGMLMMHTTLYAGGALVLMPRWQRELAGFLISRYRATSWTNIPTMIIDLLASPRFAEFDLSSLQYIGGGGAAMPAAVAQRLLEQYGLHFNEGYGLTETAAPTHVNPPDRSKQQCLGIPYMSTKAYVIDPETCVPLPSGQQGEIIVSGPQVFDGYWKQAQATEMAFIEIDGERFFRTGDLGYQDEEGYFFLTDRLKRMINASGFKVWPAEVESLMFRHPAIQEACVIAARDAYRGETVKAVVVLRAGHEQTNEQDIIEWCRQHMAVYKAPKIVEFAEALPKSGSGKVMWRRLQQAEE